MIRQTFARLKAFMSTALATAPIQVQPFMANQEPSIGSSVATRMKGIKRDTSIAMPKTHRTKPHGAGRVFRSIKNVEA